MKSLCIKTNNSEIIHYLLEKFADYQMDQVYFSEKHFRVYQNVIIHYLRKARRRIYLSFEWTSNRMYSHFLRRWTPLSYFTLQLFLFWPRGTKKHFSCHSFTFVGTRNLLDTRCFRLARSIEIYFRTQIHCFTWVCQFSFAVLFPTSRSTCWWSCKQIYHWKGIFRIHSFIKNVYWHPTIYCSFFTFNLCQWWIHFIGWKP